ncbi:hypothetical protein [Hyalangium rubrum]|uniref:Lipoprotein n=1 Tax=Hyalangium rubrum TaxID=3103134 RepID=A0ABU5H0P7_9BACT|nr:hypothetical protein [Hyalangium sp. s54d21]MDY7227014.1 hypothetical protein [Hyalangium sp. s54d21]
MRRHLKSLWLVPALLASACGPTDLPVNEEQASLDVTTQEVLYAPPPPASGNILDSTTYMGAVAVPGAVQTRFTTNPQYFSFNFQVRAGAQVKLEVTHLGSSMGLDTGLFVYGPKGSDGRYSSAILALDDDDGYGQLSKIDSVTLATQGDYLAVVSAGAGSGKQFRLQLSCLSGNCAPVLDPSLYDACELNVATRIEICVQARVEEVDPVLGRRMTAQEAYDACTGSDDAHANYLYVCNGGSEQPEFCAGGEPTYTELMWPVCKDFYKHYYGLYTLTLAPEPISANLQSKVSAGNAWCQTQNWSTCHGALESYSFPWSTTATPWLQRAAEAVANERGGIPYWGEEVLTYAQFVAQANPNFQLDPALLNDVGNGTEAVQVHHYYDQAMTAPDYCEWFDTYVLLFPESHKVAVFDYVYGRDC